MVQLAGSWLRNQPASAPSLRFHGRVERDGGRGKKAMIVALDRKLLVALWRCANDGVAPFVQDGRMTGGAFRAQAERVLAPSL